MEPVLTNRCRFEAETFRTAYKRNFRKWFIPIVGAGLLFVAGAVFEIVRYHELFSYQPLLVLGPIIFLLGAAYFFWYAFTGVRRAVKRTVQRLMETRQVSSYERVYRFTEAEICCESDIAGPSGQIPYSVIRRLVPYQNLILVYTRAKQYLMLDRTRFENGAEADFWKLMNEKCPGAVPKKYRPGQPNA